MDMIINLNNVYRLFHQWLQNRAYLVIFIKLKSKLVFCQQQQSLFALVLYNTLYI